METLTWTLVAFLRSIQVTQRIVSDVKFGIQIWSDQLGPKWDKSDPIWMPNLNLTSLRIVIFQINDVRVGIGDTKCTETYLKKYPIWCQYDIHDDEN